MTARFNPGERVRSPQKVRLTRDWGYGDVQGGSVGSRRHPVIIRLLLKTSAADAAEVFRSSHKSIDSHQVATRTRRTSIHRAVYALLNEILLFYEP